MKVSVLGSGIVGEVLANGFIKHGYEVMRASRTPQKLEDWKKTSYAKIGNFEEAAKWGDCIVLAIKGSGAESAIDMAGAKNFDNKTVIDVTNPITDQPPTDGVLHLFTKADESLMQRLQLKVPKAHFVKAFNSVGNARMVNPNFKGDVPTMFICGNNQSAKSQVSEILTLFGWEIQDMGTVEAARAIEPLCVLWCIPGFRENSWTHAFRLLH